MTGPLVSILLIPGSLLLLVGVLFGVRMASKRLSIDPEVQRKIVHIALGAYALTFPFLFDEPWQVVVLCTLAMILLISFRLKGQKSSGFASALHGVQRESFGELYFAAAVAILFYLKGDTDLLYLLPIAILTLADAAAALVGSQYGRNLFKAGPSSKSREGVVVFFLIAWLTSIGALLHFSAVPPEKVFLLALVVALFAATIEADSWWGLDNLLVPLGVYFLLRAEILNAIPDMLGAVAVFTLLLVFATLAARALGIEAHAARMTTLILFCVWAGAGLQNMFTPVVAIAGFVTLQHRAGRQDQSGLLRMLLIVVVIGMTWMLLAPALGQDMTRLYHSSFALLAALLFGLAFPGSLARRLLLACAILGTVLAQVWFDENGRAFDAIFAGVIGTLLVTATALAPYLARLKPGVRVDRVGLACMGVAAALSPVLLP